MAFFGTTALGYQNLIKERTIPDFRENTELGQLKYKGCQEKPRTSRVISLPDGRFPVAAYCSNVSLEEKNNGSKESRSACPQLFPPLLSKTESRSERKYDHGKSYAKLMDLRYRHVRSGKEPVEIYRHPTLTSHEIGRWRANEPIGKCEPWTKGPRFIYTESEMTKFVNKMAISNREFSLF